MLENGKEVACFPPAGRAGSLGRAAVPWPGLPVVEHTEPASLNISPTSLLLQLFL